MLIEDYIRSISSGIGDKQTFCVMSMVTWVFIQDLDPLYDMIEIFSEKEEYMACAGINEGIDKIEEILVKRLFIDLPDENEQEEFIEVTLEDQEDLFAAAVDDVINEIYKMINEKDEHSN